MSLAQRQTERLSATLERAYGGLSGSDLLRRMAQKVFPGRLAVVSSFGAESALLLSQVAEVDPGLPVIFLDAGQHFAETLAYRDRLAARFGLTDVRSIKPEAAALRQRDADAALWSRDPDGCCHLRKVVPLQQALDGFDAWVTGRKRYQSRGRAALASVEAAEGRIKINPMASWTREHVDQAMAALELPPHPLETEGYLSIGCWPCTRPVSPGEAARAGRWAGCGKTECGIHWPMAQSA